jgi:hypothetical protein
MPQDHPAASGRHVAAGVSSQCPPHVGELRRRDDNDTIGRRGPDELAALQPLSIERHAQSVMPKDLHEVAPAPTKHKEIAGARIVLQRLLQPAGRGQSSAACVGMTRRDPHSHTGGDGNHRRGGTFSTAAARSGSTVPYVHCDQDNVCR